MTWFSLPTVRPDNTDPAPPFVDLAGCNAWLAAQPLANAPLMQGELGDALEAINTWPIPARTRYKVLDALRKAIFAVDTESAKRFEHRPLPLTAIEQLAFDNSCRIWRQLAIGYLHCLRACLDGDASIAEHGAKVAHRVLTTLRCEQIARYRAGAAVPGNWWRLLHAAYAAAEQMDVLREDIADRLFAETRESSATGQYAMAVLTHLARPYELSRSQFAATLRWLARWRELAAPHADAESARYARHVTIDLSSDAPVHAGVGAPAMARWLPLDGVLGKLKNRLKGLKEGQSPEDLKLGSGISTEACIGLLQYLHSALQGTPQGLPEDRSGKPVGVSPTVETAYRLLGGKALTAPGEPSAISNRRVAEQIAIFGRASREEENTFVPEGWRLLQATASDLLLVRPAELEGERIALRALMAVQLDDQQAPVIVITRSLTTTESGDLIVAARIQAANGTAMLATGREKVTTKVTPQPTVFVPANPALEKPASLFIAAGVMSRLIRLDTGELPGGLKPGNPIDRGSNYERLACS